MPQFVGTKVRLARRTRGLTQTVLAHQVGLSTRIHLAKVEAGEDAPSLALVVRLATALDVSIEYLLRDTIPPADERTLQEHWQLRVPRDIWRYDVGIRNIVPMRPAKL